MSDFIIKEENFSLKFMEKMPKPKENECFLLYQTGAGSGTSMVISNGGKYSPTAIRSRHYNKKVILSLKNLDFNQDYRVVMVDVDFYFNVNVGVIYKLRDVQSYYFQGQIEGDGISNIIRERVRKQNKRWNVSQGWELRNELELLIENDLERHQGVEFKLTVEVIPDEEALEMQKSNRSKTVGIHVSNNKTEEQIAINADKEKLMDSETRLKNKQIEDVVSMMQKFGILGPVLNEYLQGNIDGIELRDYIMKSKTDAMNLLTVAMGTEMLTQSEVITRLNTILEDTRFTQIEQKSLSENRERQEDLDKKDEEWEDEEKQQTSYTQGDFL